MFVALSYHATEYQNKLMTLLECPMFSGVAMVRILLNAVIQLRMYALVVQLHPPLPLLRQLHPVLLLLLPLPLPRRPFLLTSKPVVTLASYPLVIPPGQCVTTYNSDIVVRTRLVMLMLAGYQRDLVRPVPMIAEVIAVLLPMRAT